MTSPPSPSGNDVGPRSPFADRVHCFSAPRWFMYAALTTDRLHWLALQPGEIEPQVLEAVPDERVVWSSFWPVSQSDTIVFDLVGDEQETSVRFRWFSDSPPDERGIAITRQRLNLKFGSDIRGRVNQWTRGTWDQPDHAPPARARHRRAPDP